MDLGAARERIANGAPAGVNGIPRPPGVVGDLPALIVGDPISINYHTAKSSRHTVTLPIRVIVARTAEQDGTEQLDDLISYGSIPATLEALDPSGDYVELAVLSVDQGYFDFQDQGRTIGVAADLITDIIFTT